MEISQIDNLNEEWVTINGTTEYQISNLGNVRKLIETDKYKLITKTKINIGYEKVSISRNGHSCTVLIHRLVAEHFLENPLNLSHVDHIDRNKLNNKYTNLRWCTHADNCKNKKNTIEGKKNGVTFCKSHQKWRAGGSENGKSVFLGYYQTYNEAVVAREKWENNDPFYESNENLYNFSAIQGKPYTKRVSGTGSIYKRTDDNGDKWRVKFDKTFNNEEQARLFLERIQILYAECNEIKI